MWWHKPFPCFAIPFMLLGTALSLAPSEEQGNVVDYFLAQGQQVKLTIRRDRIGLIANRGVSLQALERFIDHPQWTLEPPLDGGLTVLRLNEPREPRELEKLVRTLTERNAALKSDKPMQQAGLLVVRSGSEIPMLLTDEFVVEFKEDVTSEFVNELNAKYRVQVVRRSPFQKNRYVLRSNADSNLSFLEAPLRYYETNRVDYAHPNFVRPKIRRSKTPNDAMFGLQWHHENSGRNGGTPDADIDTPLAWDITQGSKDRVIAVIDFGFETEHKDLVDNLWVNPGETAGDGADNDSNSLVDDVHGWNFHESNNDLEANGDWHGTWVAGSVGARGDNHIGVSGTCQQCSLMLLKIAEISDEAKIAEAFDYARIMGAEVINISWGYKDELAVSPAVMFAISKAAIEGRGGKGCVVFGAMSNDYVDHCDDENLASLSYVIAVSASTNTDQFAGTGFGNCMDVLAPTRNPSSRIGTLGITTTTLTPVLGEYTEDANGTSIATPIAAGIAGLMLDVAPTLTRQQVQRVIQDTSDKIEHSKAEYSLVTGRSSPDSGLSTHGFGRVNAFEAVRLVAPKMRAGRDRVDIMLRDNRLDWGNTEQPSSTLFEPVRAFIPHWESVDIKIDAPPFQTPPTNSDEFDSLSDEDPKAIVSNRVYVRIRNRGPRSADSVTVKLHWAFAGTAIPALPADFWTVFPADSTDTSHWHPLKSQTIHDLDYCGASVAGKGTADEARIVAFDFKAPALDPAQPAFQHYCLFCVADSPQDPVTTESRSSLIPDQITPRDNNVTQRNIVLQPFLRDDRFRVRFYLRNPFPKPLTTRIEITAPPGWQTELDEGNLRQAILLRPNEERLLLLQISSPDAKASGEIVLTQYNLQGDKPSVIGGLTVRMSPP